MLPSHLHCFDNNISFLEYSVSNVNNTKIKSNLPIWMSLYAVKKHVEQFKFLFRHAITEWKICFHHNECIKLSGFLIGCRCIDFWIRGFRTLLLWIITYDRREKIIHKKNGQKWQVFVEIWCNFWYFILQNTSCFTIRNKYLIWNADLPLEFSFGFHLNCAFHSKMFLNSTYLIRYQTQPFFTPLK